MHYNGAQESSHPSQRSIPGPSRRRRRPNPPRQGLAVGARGVLPPRGKAGPGMPERDLSPDRIDAIRTGMRLGECMQVRVKDLDFDLAQITVRDGKGGKDRFAILPNRIDLPLRKQVERVRALHQRDSSRPPGKASAPSHPCPKEDQEGDQRGRNHESRHDPHLPPHLRHPAPPRRVRSPHRPEPHGPQGSARDHAIPPRSATHRHERPQPPRSLRARGLAQQSGSRLGGSLRRPSRTA